MASDQDSPSAVSELYVCGYRSIRNLRLKLDRVNVLVGPNGCGKTNLYQSMVLLSAAAQGQLARALAEEGGMPSVLWAGPRKKGPVRLVLGFSTGDFHYELQCGLPVPGMSMFNLDPEVKEEHIWFTYRGKKAALLERDHGSVRARNAEGVFEAYPMALPNSESVLSQLREPHRFPELSMLRQEILSWRFYHHFRTDREAPLRQPQVGVRTTVLSHDGRDLAAALQTIVEIGDRVGLDEAIGKAFPGSSVEVVAPENRFSVLMQMPATLRSKGAVRRHASLSLPPRCFNESSPSRPAGAERAGNQPAPEPFRTSGGADRPRGQGFASLDHHPLPSAGWLPGS